MKYRKRLGAFGLAVLCLVMGAVPAFGAESPKKDEVIYVNLDPEGKEGTIYVVNSYDLTRETAITDYGDYRTVKNLTTTADVLQSGDTVTVTAPAGKFYYQGELDGSKIKDLPWQVSVKYFLDGKETPGAQIAGATGSLEIRGSLTLNPDADPVYADNFALQTTVLLDTVRCKNIAAPGATLADVGADKQMSYIVLPGKEKEFSITADVENFEMDGIQVNAIPLVLEIEDPDTSEIKDQIYDLQDGAAQLDNGAMALEDGVDELENGVLELRDGAEDLRDGAAEVNLGANQLQAALGRMESALAELLGPLERLVMAGQIPAEAIQQLQAGFGQFKAGFSALAAGTGEVADGAYQLAEGVDALYDGVLELRDGVTELSDGTTQLRDQSSDIDGQVDEKVNEVLDEYRSKEFEPPSFVSSKNTNVAAVQFVIKTGDIRIVEQEATEQREEAEEPDFWQRLTDLFRRDK